MCIMVPMGRVQVICDFRNYNYWTVNAIGFRASRELCSNFLLITRESSYCFQHVLAIAILSVRHTGGSVKNGAS